MVNGVRTPPGTRALVEGALMAGLTAMLALMGIYIPLLQVLTNLVWTIPIVVVTVRHGIAIGIMSTFVAGMLIFALSSPLTAVLLMLQFGGLALVYGYAFNKKLQPGVTLFLGAITAIVSFILAFYASFLVFGLNPAAIITQLRDSIEPTIQLYKEMGLLNSAQVTEEAVRQTLQGVIDVIAKIIPAILVIYGMTSALINYFIAEKVLYKLKNPIPKIPRFMNWRVPWWAIWGFIAAYGINMAGVQLQNEILLTIGANILLVYEMITFVLGLSVTYYLIDKYFAGALIYRLIFLLLMVFLFKVAGLILIAIGLTDLIFNYRRLPG